LPGKIFYEHDPVLSEHVAAKEADAAYEALCKFYVAMTRAKRAMYVITKTVGSSGSRNFPKLLEQSLGENWEDGDRAWYAALTVVPPSDLGLPGLMPLVESDAGRVARLPSRRPSDAKPGAKLISLFGREGEEAADFGTKVHELFETVEWWEGAAASAWTAEQQSRGMDAAALAEVLGCLQSPALAELFGRSADWRGEVWRERSFEVVLAGVWLTGVFDRVLIERDATGGATGACVIDFKTDRAAGDNAVARAIEKYRGQIELYRRVVGVLTGLPEARVSGIVVLTAGRRLVEIPQSA
jgi:ATP-dependent helicase/nuclease subunit A